MATPQAATTVDKALDVLFALHESRAPQGVTALGRTLGLPKSSTHRLLVSLAGRGLVERDDAGRYRPGIGLVALGLGVLEREPVVAAARPILEAEAAALGETVFLVAARAGRLVVLEKAEGTGFLRAAPSVGSIVPVHATAAGKLFLAFDPERVEAPDARLEAFTPHTVGSGSALAREIARARSQGFAHNREEWIAGLSVVAAPVRVRGRMEGAVAVAASTPRLDALGAESLASRCVAAADHVAARLEGRSA